MMKGRRVAIAGVVAVVGFSWFGHKHHSCQQRNAALWRQVEAIKQDAHAQIKRGTKKSEVARFFAQHGIAFSIVGSGAFGTPEATGALRTSGCAPFGCGSDVAEITVHVKLDEAGAAAEEPTVGGIYTDCL